MAAAAAREATATFRPLAAIRAAAKLQDKTKTRKRSQTGIFRRRRRFPASIHYI